MKHEPYAEDRLLFYPGRALSAAERERIDNLDIGIDEVTVDHLVYSMSRQIENNFQTFFTVAEDVVGDERAREIAFEIGRRYGGAGYARLLAAQGKDSAGEARDMAVYQDLVHSIRGPKHASALYAEYSASRCVVRRDECIYFSETHPENGKYTAAFEAGCFEGYKQADANLLRVEVHRCKWRGDAGCEQHWVYREDGLPPPDEVAAT
jgi:hypothetical protein